MRLWQTERIWNCCEGKSASGKTPDDGRWPTLIHLSVRKLSVLLTSICQTIDGSQCNIIIPLRHRRPRGTPTKQLVPAGDIDVVNMDVSQTVTGAKDLTTTREVGSPCCLRQSLGLGASRRDVARAGLGVILTARLEYRGNVHIAPSAGQQRESAPRPPQDSPHQSAPILPMAMHSHVPHSSFRAARHGDISGH